MKMPPFAKIVPAVALVSALPLCFAAGHVAKKAAPSKGSAVGQATGDSAAGDSAVVDAANGFLATLSEAQKAKAEIELTKAGATKWTNLPAGPNGRNGVQFRSLSPTQLAAALKVAKLALGEAGYARLTEIRAADDLLGKSDHGGPGGRRGPGGPPPGGFGGPPPDGQDGPPQGGGPGGGGPGGPGGGGGYSAGNYIIAFLGAPSSTTPWMLQIGGHHLAFNVYYRGATSTATPYFVGVEPPTWKDAEGKSHGPLAPMRDAMAGLLGSLTSDQLAQARLDQRFSDVYLGPRRDGQFPEQQGVAVTNLSAASQKLVKEAIAAWTGDSARAAEYQKLYDSELAQTKVAYSGSASLKNQGDYVRIDGPHVWIEFVCQNGVVFPDQIHFHTIWRDHKSDYGASFAF